MREIAIRHVDVFTDETFSGNPLTVILEAEGLSDSQMQQIASEFGTPISLRKTRILGVRLEHFRKRQGFVIRAYFPP